MKENARFEHGKVALLLIARADVRAALEVTQRRLYVILAWAAAVVLLRVCVCVRERESVCVCERRELWRERERERERDR